MQINLVKRSSGADNLLLFLISAAVAVLGTRMYLHIFNYPQIATGGIHVAHAIFGGVLLFVSVILLLTFHGKRLRQASAIISGLGFGLFIDEVGKFITRDNNYFYQPVPMIIYLCFITVFFLYRYFDRYTPRQARELSYDLIEQLEELAEDRYFDHHRVAIKDIVEKILQTPESSHHWFARGLAQMIPKFPLQPTPNRSKLYTRIHTSRQWLDDLISERKPVFYFLMAVFVVYVVLTFWTMSTLFYHWFGDSLDINRYGITSRVEWYVYLSGLGSQIVSAVWMCRGFAKLVRRERQRALVLFKNGLAINILVTHVFTFYIEQFSAAISLAGMLICFAIVDQILDEAEEVNEKDEVIEVIKSL